MSKILIITAPSGSGKSTIVKEVLKQFPQIKFSISACTRNPRGAEQDGVDYYFMSVADFEHKIQKDAFVEWEMVYEGKYYGTLKSELERIWKADEVPLFDIDVQGAVNVKKRYREQALSIFIQAPSIDELQKRLISRGTDPMDAIEERIAKAATELTFAPHFDHTVVNDTLEHAVVAVTRLIANFLHT
ncbi:guanylate kinase [Taibaiella sp. KBW10]|uniref:guanylate kinase n=1 Tax=Taibaiella sp. KBW10 TaxID=2153357 RepID=UPI000F5A6855|nr:guanylate kinase [Taibaiella sp. KBW10]RQO32344.1 guanylate kinase [Taibaiella sp. KBW10]